MKTKPYIGVLAANGGREKFMSSKGPLRDLLGTRYSCMAGPFKSELDAMEMLMIPSKPFPGQVAYAAYIDPLKPTTERQPLTSIIRLPPIPHQRKAAYMAAAKAAGKGLSEWMLAACDEAETKSSEWQKFLDARRGVR